MVRQVWSDEDQKRSSSIVVILNRQIDSTVENDLKSCNISLTPSTPMSDQDRISIYKNMNTILSKQVIRLRQISIGESLVDPIGNSLN